MVYSPTWKKGIDAIESTEEHTLSDSHSARLNERDVNAGRSEEDQGGESTSMHSRKHKIGGGEKSGIKTPKKTKDNPKDACSSTEEENEQLMKGKRVKEADETRTKRRKPRQPPTLKNNSSLSDEYQSSPRIKGRKKSGSGSGEILKEAAAMDTGDDVVPPPTQASVCSRLNEDCMEDKKVEGEGIDVVKNNNPPIKDEDHQPENARNEEPLVSPNGTKGGEEEPPSSPSVCIDSAAHLLIDTAAHVAEDGEGGGKSPSPPQPSPSEQTEDVSIGNLEPVPCNRKRRLSSLTPTPTSSSGQLVDEDKLIPGIVANNQIKQGDKLETEEKRHQPPDRMEICTSNEECSVRADDLQSLDLPPPVKSHEVEEEVVPTDTCSSPVATKSSLKGEEEDHVPPSRAEENNDCLPQLEQHVKMGQPLTPKSQPLPLLMSVKKEEKALHVENTAPPVKCKSSDRLGESKLPLEGNKSELVKKQAKVSSEGEKFRDVKPDRNECIASGDRGAKGNSGTEPEDVAASCGIEDDANNNHQPSVLTDKAVSSKGEDLPSEPQGGDISVALKPPASTNGEEGGGVASLQHQSSSSAEEFPRVQCTQCQEWRKLPLHVQPSSLSEKWVCKDNIWDQNGQSCVIGGEVAGNEKVSSNRLNHSPTSNAHGVPSEVNADQWVQCEADYCHKWRRVPASVNLETLPDKWFCHMNMWDSARARCEAPEEKDEQQLLQPSRKPLNQMPAGHGQRNGLGSSRANPNSPTSLPPPPKPRGRPRRSSLSNGTAAPNNATAPPSSPIKWVQCDEKSCKKWRCLPPGVDPKSLPEKWFCSMNTDPRFASCNAPEQLEEPVKGPAPPNAPHSFGSLNSSTVGEGKGEFQGHGRSYILARQAKPNGKLSYREIMFSANGNLKAPFAEYEVALRMQMPLSGRVDDATGNTCSHVHQPLLRTASCYPRCGTYEAEIGIRQKVQSACSSIEFISPCKIYGQVLLADDAPPGLSTPTIIKQEHVNSHLRMLELDGIVESNKDGGFRLTANGIVPNSRFMHGRPPKLVKAWRREQG